MRTNPETLRLLASAVLLLLPAGMGAAANFTTGSGPARKFGVHELTFTGNGGVADPLATSAKVTFIPPSGRRDAKTVEMFWDGGNSWRARAYVTASGDWSWTSSCAGDPALDGLSGKFRAESSTLRGQLKPHPANPRALATDDGQWFAPIGDTAYYLLGAAAYQTYVRDDWSCGVNFLRCSSFGHLRDFAAHFTMPGAAGLPNLASLQADDTKLQWLFDQYPGMYLQYIILPEAPSGKWSHYSATARHELLQQMVARYGAFPTLTWQIINDSFYPADGTGDTALAGTVSTFLTARDVYGHLRGTGARRTHGAPFAASEWTTFLHFETLDALAADEADANAALNKFTWCGEDRYESYLPPANNRYFFRRLMWAWLLSGGSACYGGAWDATVPYHHSPRVGLDSVRFIQGYFTSRHIDLARFAYDDRVAADALAVGRDRPQACNRGTSEYIIYHPNGSGAAAGVNVNAGRTAAFNLNLTAAAGSYDVEWFRCLDGVAAPGGTVTGGALRTLTSPWAGLDVVCRLLATTRQPAVPPRQITP